MKPERFIQRQRPGIVRTDLDMNGRNVELATGLEERVQQCRGDALPPVMRSNEEIVDDAGQAAEFHAVPQGQDGMTNAFRSPMGDPHRIELAHQLDQRRNVGEPSSFDNCSHAVRSVSPAF